MAKNFPTTDDYDIEKELLSLGTGEALVTVLNESGRPTPLARVCVAPPRSRMDVLSDMELQQCLFASSLYQKY